jgi:hypothetical protein
MHDHTEPLLVACLCAAWCRTCDEYRGVFEDQAAAAGVQAAWVDIEDEEEAVDGIDVDDFPTILIARGNTPLFFGPITPQPQTLARMLQAAQEGSLRLPDAPPPVAALPARVRKLQQEH